MTLKPNQYIVGWVLEGPNIDWEPDSILNLATISLQEQAEKNGLTPIGEPELVQQESFNKIKTDRYLTDENGEPELDEDGELMFEYDHVPAPKESARYVRHLWEQVAE